MPLIIEGIVIDTSGIQPRVKSPRSSYTELHPRILHGVVSPETHGSEKEAADPGITWERPSIPLREAVVDSP